MPSFDAFASDWDNRASQEYPSLGEGQTQSFTYYVNTTLFNATNQVRVRARVKVRVRVRIRARARARVGSLCLWPLALRAHLQGIATPAQGPI